MSIRSISILLGVSALVLNGCGQASVKPDGKDSLSFHEDEAETRRIMGQGERSSKSSMPTLTAIC